MALRILEHVTVYYDAAYFAAWPFNGGMWQFADGEVAVGFVRGKVDYARPETVGHSQADVGSGEQVIMRSRDGGRTWPREAMTVVYTRPAFDAVIGALPEVRAGQGGPAFNPRADGYCLLSGFGIPAPGQERIGWAMVSTDRGHTWHPPVRLPGLGGQVGGRPSYLLRDDGTVLLFVHSARANRDEGVAVPVVLASRDGGASWAIEAEITPTPGTMAIMPYPVRLPGGRLLAAVRRQYDGRNAFTEVYASDDDARTWRFLARPNDWGAPANLTALPDGRLVCTYGYRQEHSGIRARLSHDGGATWGDELVVRGGDAGSWDVGYPRTLLLPDGTLLTAYYYNLANDPRQCEGGPRHIAATRWAV